MVRLDIAHPEYSLNPGSLYVRRDSLLRNLIHHNVMHFILPFIPQYRSILLGFCWNIHLIMSTMYWIDTLVVKTLCEVFQLLLLLLKPDPLDIPATKYYDIAIIVLSHIMFIWLSYVIVKWKKINFS